MGKRGDRERRRSGEFDATAERLEALTDRTVVLLSEASQEVLQLKLHATSGAGDKGALAFGIVVAGSVAMRRALKLLLGDEALVRVPPEPLAGLIETLLDTLEVFGVRAVKETVGGEDEDEDDAVLH